MLPLSKRCVLKLNKHKVTKDLLFINNLLTIKLLRVVTDLSN
jgi:hypothetical protein